VFSTVLGRCVPRTTTPPTPPGVVTPAPSSLMQAYERMFGGDRGRVDLGLFTGTPTGTTQPIASTPGSVTNVTRPTGPTQALPGVPGTTFTPGQPQFFGNVPGAMLPGTLPFSYNPIQAYQGPMVGQMLARNPNLSPTVLGGPQALGYYTDRLGNRILAPGGALMSFAKGGEARSDLQKLANGGPALTDDQSFEGMKLAREQQKAFTDTLAVLVQNPGMSFSRAAQLTGYKGAAQPDDPGYQYHRDKSANFDWGADLAYDPNIYANQFKWQEYIAANPDLAAAGIDTPWEAATHYSNYGKNENRPGVGFLNSGVVVRPGGYVDYSGMPKPPDPEVVYDQLQESRAAQGYTPPPAAPAAPSRPTATSMPQASFTAQAAPASQPSIAPTESLYRTRTQDIPVFASPASTFRIGDTLQSSAPYTGLGGSTYQSYMDMLRPQQRTQGQNPYVPMVQPLMFSEGGEADKDDSAKAELERLLASMPAQETTEVRVSPNARSVKRTTTKSAATDRGKAMSMSLESLAAGKGSGSTDQGSASEQLAALMEEVKGKKEDVSNLARKNLTRSTLDRAGPLVARRFADGGEASRYYGGFTPDSVKGPSQMQRTLSIGGKPPPPGYFTTPDMLDVLKRLYGTAKDNPDNLPDAYQDAVIQSQLMAKGPRPGLLAPSGNSRPTLDSVAAMELGNRYQSYLNNMTNMPKGGGMVRDERLGDQSLNMDVPGFAKGGESVAPGIAMALQQFLERAPAQVRTYAESVRDPRKQRAPLTEGSFSAQELAKLRELIAIAESNPALSEKTGKPLPGVVDYAHHREQIRRRNPKTGMPLAMLDSDFNVGESGNLRNTLGQFVYERLPDGTLVVKDRYDYTGDVAETFNPFVKYANYKGVDRPVNITLPPETKRKK